MGVDGKYGRVTTEYGNIGEDEPVIVFRAQDRLLPKVLEYYRLFCWKAGSPQRHLDLIEHTRREVEAWQEAHPPRIPDSESSREWMGDRLSVRPE